MKKSKSICGSAKKSAYRPQMFRNGNLKLDKSVGVFSLPPIKSCVNCKYCKDTCYAVQSYIQYTNTRKAWDRNLKLSKTKEFLKEVNWQLSRRERDIIRLHSSGDFYNIDYIKKWETIIKANPSKFFYGYTKNMEALKLNRFKNCNIIYSFINGYRNYGTKKYCNLLKEKFGNVHICNLEKGKKCMKDCKACLTEEHVAIVIHGNKAKKDKYEQFVIKSLESV